MTPVWLANDIDSTCDAIMRAAEQLEPEPETIDPYYRFVVEAVRQSVAAELERFADRLGR